MGDIFCGMQLGGIDDDEYMVKENLRVTHEAKVMHIRKVGFK